MYFFAIRVTNGFSVSSFEMYPEIEIFSFYFPCLIFTDVMSVFPIIGKIEDDGNIFNIPEQLLEISVGSISIVPCQNDAGGFIYSTPSPPLIGFLFDK